MRRCWPKPAEPIGEFGVLPVDLHGVAFQSMDGDPRSGEGVLQQGMLVEAKLGKHAVETGIRGERHEMIVK